MISQNRIFRIFITSVAATSAMTAFSYLVSKLKADNYRETSLLADFFRKSILKKKKRSAFALAWLVHYAVGFAFGLGYKRVREKDRPKSSFAKGLQFGTLLSVVAVSAWSALFYVHPDKPDIHFRTFYRQLAAAHLLFGLIFVKLSPGKRKLKNTDL